MLEEAVDKVGSSPLRWAYFDDRQNRLRVVAGKFVSLCWTLHSTIFQMWLGSL